MSSFGQPFASLSSGLLARKGGARPAMRRQLLGGGFDPQEEDLGWNDMGHDGPHHVQPHAGLTPMPGEHAQPLTEADVPDFGQEFAPVFAQQFAPEIKQEFAPEIEDEWVEPVEELVEAPIEVAIPAVIEERVALARAVAETPPTPRIVAPKTPPRVRAPKIAARPGAKAAFTLRLDPDRHLKLRLACAVTNRSAQMMVTEALDNFLNSLPEVCRLADQVPHEAGKRQVG